MQMKKNARFWAALLLFSLIGQVAWVVENMYFNVFIYKMFGASAADISLMVAASAVAATLTTVFIGALSDRIGKRKIFICGGYITWGISILSFALIRTDVMESLFPSIASAASLGVTLVIVMDCIMTFFGSSANDAAFNAWLTDATYTSNRGAAEGFNAMMPLVAILAVFGGFMSFDLSTADSWSTIFMIIGAVVVLVGILGIFLIREVPVTPEGSGYLKTVFYGFSKTAVRESPALYLCLLAFIIFNISIQIFMPYLIIYYEVSLGMTDYVFIMAPAIVLASVVTAFWGRVYDKKGFRFSSILALLWLLIGYAFLYFTRTTLPVFAGSLLMMSGYLAGMAVFGARIRDAIPEGKSGRLQGIRIFSQVLLPGIIGPYIGKTILADAETRIGDDGLEAFIPNANIFAAAAVPAALLFVLLLLFAKNKPPKTSVLTTPYAVGDIPHNYHPRPSMERDNYTILNGIWYFSILRRKKTVYEGHITVPFAPESALSGVGRITRRGDTLRYTRKCNVKCTDNRLLLHFGAVDCHARVFVNGRECGTHHGGYLPFSFDITEHVTDGENTFTVEVTDTLDKTYPYGKQTHRRGGMWYTPVSGIWQTVWLEEVPADYMKGLHITPTLDSVTIAVDGGAREKILTLDGEEYRFEGDFITVKPKEIRPWSPEDPYLYRFTLRSGKDTVKSYFALREISIGDRHGQAVLTLNGKPYFFHGLLDQGYYPDGLFTPASADGFADDILKMKALGFNMLRKHIKIEPEIFYYFCDLYGMAVFQDMINNGTYRFLYDTALPTVGLKKLPRREKKTVREVFLSHARETASLLYNHPSIVYYTIFNEGWGQADAKTAYRTLKALDGTRIWDTASGWFDTAPSDVQSEHIYFKKADFKFNKEKPVILSEFGGYSCNMEGHSFNLEKVYGYKICKTAEDLTNDLRTLYRTEIIPLAARGLSASVLTQVSDVEDETNGLMTYDRRITKPDEGVMQENAASLFAAYRLP